MSDIHAFTDWVGMRMADGANALLREKSQLYFGAAGFAAFMTCQLPPFQPFTLFGWAPTLRGRWL